MPKFTHKFTSFKDMADHLRPVLREQGYCLPKVKKPVPPHLCFSLTVPIDIATHNRTAGGVRVGRITENGKVRRVNLSANTAARYVKVVGDRTIEITSRKVIEDFGRGFALR